MRSVLHTLGSALVVAALLWPLAVTAREYHYLAIGDAARTLCTAAQQPAPAAWEQPGFDDAAWVAAVPDGGVAPARDGCEVLRSRRRFDVGGERERLVTLTLQVRYRDGVVVWLNGVEVARRNVRDAAESVAGEIAESASTPSATEHATDPHGVEPERIYIPLHAGLLRATDNVLAFEARPFRAGRVPALDAALDGADRLRVVRGPYLQRVLDGQAELVLETDLPSRAEVSWGTTVLDHHATDGLVDTHHRLVLRELASGRSFHYRVAVREPGLPQEGAAAVGPPLPTAPITPLLVDAAFHTPPTASHPLRFVVVGDVRSGHEVHAQIVRALVAEDPDFVLMTGDLVDGGQDEAEWQRYFDIEAPLLRQVPVYSAAGNHDHGRHNQGLDRFLSLFLVGETTPWWSFDAAGVHFAMLDSESYKNPEQLAWLKQDLALARAREPRAIFAVTHHGPWSSAVHGDNKLAQQDYVPLLEAAHVSVLFAGHDHDYERGRVGNITYVVSGGGGAELRVPRCGVPGKKSCGHRTQAFFNEHHYVIVEVLADALRMCPRRPDGTPLEPCTTLPLRR